MTTAIADHVGQHDRGDGQQRRPAAHRAPDIVRVADEQRGPCALRTATGHGEHVIPPSDAGLGSGAWTTPTSPPSSSTARSSRPPGPSHTQALMDVAVGVMEAAGRRDARPSAPSTSRSPPASSPTCASRAPPRTTGRRSSRRSPPRTSSCSARRSGSGRSRASAPGSIERLYGNSGQLNDKGQSVFYGRGRRLHHHRQRGRRQALRDEHPLLAAAPRLRDPAAGRLDLARRGRARARATATTAPGSRTSSRRRTPSSPPGT